MIRQNLTFLYPLMEGGREGGREGQRRGRREGGSREERGKEGRILLFSQNLLWINRSPIEDQSQ